MATRKAAPLEADLIARKGEAAPAQIPTPTSPPARPKPNKPVTRGNKAVMGSKA